MKNPSSAICGAETRILMQCSGQKVAREDLVPCHSMRRAHLVSPEVPLLHSLSMPVVEPRPKPGQNPQPNITLGIALVEVTIF